MEEVAGERVALVGNSLGGLIALRLALEHGEHVAALGLVASVGLGVEVSPFLQLPTPAGVGEPAVLWAQTPAGAAHRVLARAALRAHVDRHGQRDVVTDELHRLAMPTLVVSGKRDRVIPIAHGHRAVAALPRGTLTVLPGCGHLPPVERPERFNAALQGFLERSV